VIRATVATLLTVLAAGSTLGLAIQPVQAPPDAVVLRVTTPSGQTSTIAVQEGGRATVGQLGGRTLGLEPSRTAAGRLDIVISAGEINRQTDVETWLVVGRLSLALRETARFEDEVFPIVVEWVDVRPRTASGEGVPAGPCQRCCVVCGGEVICACRVQAPCGDCCCPSTCACDIIG
jgi:hypothetical protein